MNSNQEQTQNNNTNRENEKAHLNKTEQTNSHVATAQVEFKNTDDEGVILDVAQIIFSAKRTETVEKLKNTYDQDSESKVYSLNLRDVCLNVQKILPCVFIASINEQKEFTEFLNALKILRPYTKSNQLKIIVISKVKNGTIIEKLKKFGCQEYIMEPIADRQLDYKIKLHTNALKSLRRKKRRDILQQKEAEENAKKRKEIEEQKRKELAQKRAEAASLKRFSNQNNNQQKNDKWVFKAKKQGFQNEEEIVEIESKELPKEGDWVEIEVGGKKKWQFVPKGMTLEEAKKNESWVFEGEEKPVLKDGEWDFGSGGTLQYQNKDGKVETYELEKQSFLENEIEESDENEIINENESTEGSSETYNKSSFVEENFIEQDEKKEEELKQNSQNYHEDFVFKDPNSKQSVNKDYKFKEEVVEGRELFYQEKGKLDGLKNDYREKNKNQGSELSYQEKKINQENNIPDFLDEKTESAYLTQKKEAIESAQNVFNNLTTELSSAVVMAVEVLDILFSEGAFGSSEKSEIEQVSLIYKRLIEYVEKSFHAQNFAIVEVEENLKNLNFIYGEKFNENGFNQVINQVLELGTCTSGVEDNNTEFVIIGYPIFVNSKIKAIAVLKVLKTSQITVKSKTYQIVFNAFSSILQSQYFKKEVA